MYVLVGTELHGHFGDTLRSFEIGSSTLTFTNDQRIGVFHFFRNTADMPCRKTWMSGSPLSDSSVDP